VAGGRPISGDGYCVDGFCGGDEGEDAHIAAAAEGEDLIYAGKEASPAGAGGGALRGVRQVGGIGVPGGAGIVRLAACQAERAGGHRGVVASEVDHLLAQARVRCKDAVVAVAVDTGRRDEAAQCGEKLEGGEGEDGAAVAGGSCREGR
jgi:hypothetical protein